MSSERTRTAGHDPLGPVDGRAGVTKTPRMPTRPRLTGALLLASLAFCAACAPTPRERPLSRDAAAARRAALEAQIGRDREALARRITRTPANAAQALHQDEALRAVAWRLMRASEDLRALDRTGAPEALGTPGAESESP